MARLLEALGRALIPALLIGYGIAVFLTIGTCFFEVFLGWAPIDATGGATIAFVVLLGAVLFADRGGRG